MKTLLYLAIVCSAIGAPIRDQFRAVVVASDRIVVSWHPSVRVETLGISRVKKIYQPLEFPELLAHVDFKEQAPPVTEIIDGEVITIPVVNCGCVGSHFITFWKDDEVIAQMTFHHGTHIRSKLLSAGKDAVLTPAAQEWFAAQIGWNADVQKIESAQKKMPNRVAGSD
jgi:hypothetical protein